ncbi:hypothetical protein SynNOUM97013_01939 [Synechococcus sp. NOUM97013]|nr:hypothetical protein SynNOUM97013_01939 [Synechococcus sp. NOUM97013]
MTRQADGGLSSAAAEQSGSWSDDDVELEGEPLIPRNGEKVKKQAHSSDGDNKQESREKAQYDEAIHQPRFNR